MTLVTDVVGINQPMHIRAYVYNVILRCNFVMFLIFFSFCGMQKLNPIIPIDWHIDHPLVHLSKVYVAKSKPTSVVLKNWFI